MLFLLEGAYFLVIADILHLNNSIGNEYSIYKILGKSARMAEPCDIEKLRKPELMRLFYSANTPALEKLKGKFRCKVLVSGQTETQSRDLLSKIFGKSEWIEEEFSLLKNSSLKSCKTFLNSNNKGRTEVMKICNTKSYIAKSILDNRKSLHNNFQFTSREGQKSTHDEIRKINQKLFICMVYSPISGRPENPIPVILYSED